MPRITSAVGLVTAVACLALAGCGDDPAGGTGTEVGGSPSATTSPSPTAEPTVGSYPHFEPKDYSYTLRVSCFCLAAGVPIRITVEGGDVTDAVYAESGRGVKAGEPVDVFRRVSINEVIDAANDTGAASVDVTWPDGQGYPSSVYVDQATNTMDEEVGYEVSDVSVAD
ncbi:MAG: hypothetical protein JWO11_3075 [Nocardioides sp.]|nr:hypothetical protein [Nocardioides sp.]